MKISIINCIKISNRNRVEDFKMTVPTSSSSESFIESTRQLEIILKTNIKIPAVDMKTEYLIPNGFGNEMRKEFIEGPTSKLRNPIRKPIQSKCKRNLFIIFHHRIFFNHLHLACHKDPAESRYLTAINYQSKVGLTRKAGRVSLWICNKKPPTSSREWSSSMCLLVATHPPAWAKFEFCTKLSVIFV